MSTITLQQRLNDLFSYIRQGKLIEAMTEFYEQDAQMQENANPPTVGLAANIEREKQFKSGVKEWKGLMLRPQRWVTTSPSTGSNKVHFALVEGDVVTHR